MLIRSLRFILILIFLLSLSLILSGCKSPVVSYEDIEVTSAAFAHGEVIPAKYSRDGENVSPQLQWGALPQGTVSLAVISDDPDAPGETWVHWVVYNIPTTTHELTEGIAQEPSLADGSMQGMNSWGNIGYDGPQPPSGQHRYYFKVYALDTMLTISGDVDKTALLNAITGHILGEGRLLGLFGEEE